MGNGFHCNGTHGDCNDIDRECHCDCGYCRKENGDLPWETELCQSCYEPAESCTCPYKPGESGFERSEPKAAITPPVDALPTVAEVSALLHRIETAFASMIARLEAARDTLPRMVTPAEPPPTCPAAFLDAVATLAWTPNHLVDESEEGYALTGAPGASWRVIQGFGVRLSEATYDLLRVATSEGDGFRSGGVLYLLTYDPETVFAVPVTAP